MRPSPSLKRPTRDFHWWWWAATLPFSTLFGLMVVIVVGQGLASVTIGGFLFAVLAGIMAGIGFQRSFRWVTTFYRRELKPEQPRGVLVKVSGLACFLLAGLLLVAGVVILSSFQEDHQGFLWDLASNELGIPVFVFSAAGLAAVGLRLFKGKWPNKDFWRTH